MSAHCCKSDTKSRSLCDESLPLVQTALHLLGECYMTGGESPLMCRIPPAFEPGCLAALWGMLHNLEAVGAADMHVTPCLWAALRPFGAKACVPAGTLAVNAAGLRRCSGCCSSLPAFGVTGLNRPVLCAGSVPEGSQPPGLPRPLPHRQLPAHRHAQPAPPDADGRRSTGHLQVSSAGSTALTGLWWLVRSWAPACPC